MSKTTNNVFLYKCFSYIQRIVVFKKIEIPWIFLILWNSFIHVISPILSTYFFSLNIRLGLHLSRILTEHSTSVVNLSSSSLLSDNGKLEIAINLWAELFYVTLKSTERISVFVHLMEWRTNSGISDDEFICGGIFAAHSIPWGSLTKDSSEMTPWKIHRTHLRFFFLYFETILKYEITLYVYDYQGQIIFGETCHLSSFPLQEDWMVLVIFKHFLY